MSKGTRRKTRAAGSRKAKTVGALHYVARGGGSKRGTHHLPPPGAWQCHPGNTVHGPHGAFPLKTLQGVAKQLGVPHPNATGKALRESIVHALRLPPTVGERSLLNALPIAGPEKARLAGLLRPEMPQAWHHDPDKWFDSNNIKAYLDQYEDARPDFEFMGPFPIDFAAPDPYAQGGGSPRCLMTEMCSLRVKHAMEAGTKYIGIVYNLDPHFKGGSHWIANFIDLARHRCYYFDSYGYKPPKQIETFMKWLTAQDPSMRLEYNARRLQYKNTECGTYCCYFITRMLLGDSFKEFTHRNPSDADMLALRPWMFST